MKEAEITVREIAPPNRLETVLIVIDTSAISISVPKMSVHHARCANLQELDIAVRRMEELIRALMLSAEGRLLPHDDIRYTGTIGLCVW